MIKLDDFVANIMTIIIMQSKITYRTYYDRGRVGHHTQKISFTSWFIESSRRHWGVCGIWIDGVVGSMVVNDRVEQSGQQSYQFPLGFQCSWETTKLK